MGKAGDRYLVAAWYVEAKLTLAEIRAGLRPTIQDRPTVTVTGLVDDLSGANTDVERTETFLVGFVGNYDLVRFFSVANNRAAELIVIHLEEDVVLGVGVVEHPLQEVTLGKGRGKSKAA